MITLKNIHVNFALGTPQEKQVLKGVNLEIKPTDFISVLGTNGAGKSTLLNLLAGEITPTQGSISGLFNVSRVFQDPLMGTCGQLTISENLALAEKRGQRRNLSLAFKHSKQEHYENLLKTLGLGLEERLNTPISMLSGGQRQAVSLLMATLRPCQLLLLDEHTSALDPKMARLVMKITNEIAATEKFPIFMVTHNLEDALRYGNRMILLHDGKIKLDLNKEERSMLSAEDLYRKLQKNTENDT